jgi:hypothetical protein
MIIYNMDAYLISKFVKNSLQNKKVLEHADFIEPSLSLSPSRTPSAPPSAPPMPPREMIDNSINDYSTINNMEVTNIIIENENENEDDYEDDNTSDNSASKISTGTFILLLLINSYAAYLSWDCNTAKNYPLMLKLIFSLFAFMFGTLYIIYYMLFRFDDCNTFDLLSRN